MIQTFPITVLGVAGYGYVIEDRGVEVGYAAGYMTEDEALAAAADHERRYLRRSFERDLTALGVTS